MWGLVLNGNSNSGEKKESRQVYKPSLWPLVSIMHAEVIPHLPQSRLLAKIQNPPIVQQWNCKGLTMHYIMSSHQLCNKNDVWQTITHKHLLNSKPFFKPIKTLNLW